MNTNRLKFRVWSNDEKQYMELKDLFINHEGLLVKLSHCNDPYHEKVLSNVIIEQCTGLRDKNGNLIFEGDMSSGYYYSGGDRVEWKIVMRRENSGFAWERYTGYKPDFCELIITGTIHEEEI